MPDALFERCRLCAGALRATVDLEPRPASQTLEDPVVPIEPSEDGGSDGMALALALALPRPLIPRRSLPTITVLSGETVDRTLQHCFEFQELGYGCS
jgi:hypothetical protein